MRLIPYQQGEVEEEEETGDSDQSPHPHHHGIADGEDMTRRED